ncbi:hypothetical protein AB6E06_22170 [Vibrio splendidus]
MNKKNNRSLILTVLRSYGIFQHIVFMLLVGFFNLDYSALFSNFEAAIFVTTLSLLTLFAVYNTAVHDSSINTIHCIRNYLLSDNQNNNKR